MRVAVLLLALAVAHVRAVAVSKLPQSSATTAALPTESFVHLGDALYAAPEDSTFFDDVLSAASDSLISLNNNNNNNNNIGGDVARNRANPAAISAPGSRCELGGNVCIDTAKSRECHGSFERGMCPGATPTCCVASGGGGYVSFDLNLRRSEASKGSKSVTESLRKYGSFVERHSEQMSSPDMRDAKRIAENADGGDRTARKVRTWRNLIDTQRPKLAQDPLNVLKTVNRIVNQLITYVRDTSADKWKTPLESFGEGGDCEDFALAKYVTLRDIGFPVDHLHVTYVKDRAAGAHMILLAKLNGRTYVLDNFKTFREGKDARSYTAVYGFNRNNLSFFRTK